MNQETPFVSNMTDYLLEILISVILIFLATSLVLFLITLVKRARKIKKTALKMHYQKTIDQAIFTYLFDDKETNIEEENIFQFDFSRNSLFKKIAIKSIVSLHNSYSGDYQKKLASFYVKSGLVNYSIQKLNSKKWYHKVEAIRDLSNLRYEPGFEKIKHGLSHPHELVQAETLIALLKLKGMDELIKQENSSLFLNDWIQSNILFTIKSNRINNTGNLHQLLQSKNVSFQLLGVRLIHHYKDRAQLNQLMLLENQTSDFKLKSEIQQTIHFINNDYKEGI